MSADICVVGDCGNKVKVKRLGMCEKHYMRQRRTGSVELQYSFSECEVCSKPIRCRRQNKRFCSSRCWKKGYIQKFKVQVSCLGCKRERTLRNYNEGSGQCNKCAALTAAKVAGAANRLLASVRYWEPPKPKKRVFDLAQYIGYGDVSHRLRPVVSVCVSDKCGRLFVGSRRGQSLCSKKCTRRVNKVRQNKTKGRDKGKARNRLLKYGTPITSYTYEPGITACKVAERDNWKCAECGIDVEQHHGGGYHSNGATVGHIVPLSKGGSHTWRNVQCECHECNNVKGANHQSIDDAIMAMAHAEKKGKGVNGLRGASAN